MPETSHILHTAKLKNNCPECSLADSLELTFTQIENENRFYSKASKNINSVMRCNSCDTTIYPVSWNEDLERVYEYNRKLAKPKPTGIKLKPLAYFIIILDAIIIGIVIYLLK
ncbi:MAG: hypothetical protein KJO05_06395 [Bacteroidia bacterium]|nr:hypothetical protein [Bacteroidia bacterium]NNF30430.1 hypothetical protein [Flavobacteriaceae bacterium]MBT8275669.1 hypothetical protein [Bacteroidia bacterium]NNJ82657.1 hypothetical protein [Flavobacteriaceae bacterium]NNK54312.1 hypothetical protein [Flavobacteriaceae bacterium]